MIDETFARNIGAITEKEQEKLANAKVGIAGMGGIGSPAFEILTRIGTGNFVIFDKDKIERTNFNRQLYATKESFGKWKVDVAVEKAKAINPKVKIEKYAEKLDETNVKKLGKCGVVVDGMDNVTARKTIAEFCSKNRIPYVFCSAGMSRGMVSVFRDADFGKIFGRMKEPKRKSIIAPAAFLAGVLSASQAVNVLLGKKYVKAPEFLFFDLFFERVFWKQRI